MTSEQSFAFYFRFSTADCDLGFALWWAYTLEHGALFDDFPILLAYLQRVRARPAFQIGKKDAKWDWSNCFTKYMRDVKRSFVQKHFIFGVTNIAYCLLN